MPPHRTLQRVLRWWISPYAMLWRQYLEEKSTNVTEGKYIKELHLNPLRMKTNPNQTSSDYWIHSVHWKESWAVRIPRDHSR